MSNETLPSRRLLHSTGFKTAVWLAVVAVLVVWLGLINLQPDLSHLDNTLLSGSDQGQYFQLGEVLSTAAATRMRGETPGGTPGGTRGGPKSRR